MEEIMLAKKANKFFIFEFLPYLYVLFTVLYLIAHPYDFGQEIPAKIYIHYILPSVVLFAILFSLLGAYPFFILKQIDIPRDTYPTIEGIFKNDAYAIVYQNFTYSFCMLNNIYSIMGPIYYFIDYYLDRQIGVFETILVIVYLVAFILHSRIWLHLLFSFFNCILNTINLWKFMKSKLTEHRHISI